MAGKSKIILLSLVVVAFIAALVVGIAHIGATFYSAWQQRDDQTYAACNRLDSNSKNQLSTLFETKTLEAVEYSCGELEGAFPTKTWTIDYYIRGNLEPQKTTAELENELSTKILAAGWKKDENIQSNDRYQSQDNTKNLTLDILSARHNLYKLTVSTTNKDDSEASKTTQPVDKAWSDEILLQYSPFDLPQLTYAPANASWSKPSHVSGEQFTYRLNIDEKVKPTLSARPGSITENDAIIGTGTYNNPIYLDDERKGDYQTVINGVVYTLTNLRNLNNTSQFGDDEAIKIFNGIASNQ